MLGRARSTRPSAVAYLTIPEITEAEDVISYSMGTGGTTFSVAIRAEDVAVRLQKMAVDGTLLPLVVLATDGGMFAMDDVVIESYQFVSTADAPLAEITFNARDVRLV
jgi:hypothetical protein